LKKENDNCPRQYCPHGEKKREKREINAETLYLQFAPGRIFEHNEDGEYIRGRRRAPEITQALELAKGGKGGGKLSVTTSFSSTSNGPYSRREEKRVSFADRNSSSD